jgi:phosphate:Na+ symporter
MEIVTFLISITGATMLLLFAVRLVRTGIERSYGAMFKRAMTHQRSVLGTSLVGVILALVLQSSAAVAVLTSGFAASGSLGFGTGLALVLGGDLGSALIISVLSANLDWLVPVLLAVGGWLFVKTETKKLRQAGRIVMGIALILVSLQFMRDAMDPIRESAFLPTISDYLTRDYITAFIVGGSLAFLMHSSVAAILMCVTLVQVGGLPFAAGLSLVFGANLGSAFIPVWLTRDMPLAARRIVWSNLMLRGIWALIALFACNLAMGAGIVVANHSAQVLVIAHIVFNASLLLVALPFCNALQSPAERLLPDQTSAAELKINARAPTALDPSNVGTPTQAQSSLKRELLHMIELVEAMFRPVMALYGSGEKASIRSVQLVDQEVNECLARIRIFVASIPIETVDKDSRRLIREMLDYAIRLETAGDVVALRLMVLATNLHKTGVKFSDAGWSELQQMHEDILANIKLASNVLISDDLESARMLNMEKTEIKHAERKSRKRHFKRLHTSVPESLESSDIHLETLRAFRDFNSNIAAVATPILYANGQLLETRLIEEISVPGKLS